MESSIPSLYAGRICRPLPLQVQQSALLLRLAATEIWASSWEESACKPVLPVPKGRWECRKLCLSKNRRGPFGWGGEVNPSKITARKIDIYSWFSINIRFSNAIHSSRIFKVWAILREGRSSDVNCKLCALSIQWCMLINTYHCSKILVTNSKIWYIGSAD